ncbi:hypothetical protein BJ986_002221 [Phycicoccus badiiscoriae]|uniref:Uncharacterized protein n=1 Tax=Pedococcus badiiscoriae TaxID=642776 RepID=A0A852WLS7_9MICO|nr:hypothetical protein [Pedococcus badiiscoriae]NYG07734.1 hypothetical protein [Pedococcus badiiscoriae]
MPPAPADPDRLRSLGAALGPLRECAGQGATEVLAQFPEVGDRETQAALDGWVEQAADLLREIDAAASDLADRLRIAALSAGTNAGVTAGSPPSPDQRPEAQWSDGQWSDGQSATRWAHRGSGEAYR